MTKRKGSVRKRPLFRAFIGGTDITPILGLAANQMTEPSWLHNGISNKLYYSLEVIQVLTVVHHNYFRKISHFIL
jgi:hypothetical protein